jgi:response regulator RpfG family c-di-GMP phosphodiesterase
LYGEGRQVLVVEDDQAVRSMLASYLKKVGFTVVETADVTEGLRAMGREFDVVITDIRLPGPSGNELVAAVKARWPETQAVVVTGFRDAQVAVEALNAGADRYLFKPFGIPELQAHLVDALIRRDRILADRHERLRLAEEARRRRGEAHEAILRGTRALVRAVEVRDPYTQGHSERVAQYAVALARGLETESGIDLDRLFLACELHDLGKIGIPDAILNKEGPLTTAEFDEVRKHPDTGRRILEPLLGDELILAVTRWHHERWDGLGYPDGLAGAAIPQVARIVALADTLDAMTSTRAYRNRVAWDDAVAHIAEQGGSQFDPDLMRHFEVTLPELRGLFTNGGEG